MDKEKKYLVGYFVGHYKRPYAKAYAINGFVSKEEALKIKKNLPDISGMWKALISEEALSR